MKRPKPTPSAKPSAPQSLDYAHAGTHVVRLKPRPRLFATLCICFALWIGALLWLYFKTVYPQRHGINPTPPGRTQ